MILAALGANWDFSAAISHPCFFTGASHPNSSEDSKLKATQYGNKVGNTVGDKV
jgi:hypothetical protein